MISATVAVERTNAERYITAVLERSNVSNLFDNKIYTHSNECNEMS